MEPTSTLFNFLAGWLASKVLDGLTIPLTKKWREKRRITAKILTAFQKAAAQTHTQYHAISWVEVIGDLNPVLQTELEKLITEGEDPDELVIGEALCKHARTPLNPYDVGYFFIERMEDNLLPITELSPTLTLRHTFKSRRAQEHILAEVRRNLRPAEPIALLPNEEQAVETAFAARAPGLLEWPQVLPDGAWLDRPELGTLTETINTKDHSTTILLGSPGSGKSALLSRLGNIFQDEGSVTVVAIKADQLSATINTDKDLGAALGLEGPAMETIRRLSATNKILLLVDQMDAVADLVDLHTGRLNRLIDLVTSLYKVDGIHIVASARTFEFNHDPRFTRIEAESIVLNLPSWDVISPIIAAHGAAPETWTTDRKEMMRAPQSLSTFIGLTIELDGVERVAETYQGMLDQIWDARLTTPELRSFVSHVARRMAEREELSLAIAIFDNEANLLHQGMDAGFFIREAGRPAFQFSHQSLFDHAVARGFVTEEDSLVDYISRHQDSLSPRPRIWAVLTYLREVDPASYQNQLQQIWGMDRLRYHLKCLIIDFLGARENPHPFEQRIVLEGFATDGLVFRAARAISGNQGWFGFVRENILPAMMNETGRRLDGASMILCRALPFAQDDVFALMEANWSNRDKIHLRASVLRLVVNWTDAAIRLAEPLAENTKIENWTVCEIATLIGADNPGQGAHFSVMALRAETERLKQAARDNAKPIENEVKSLLKHRGNGGWYELIAVPQAAPNVFLREAAPWFLEVAITCARPEGWYPYMYREGDYIGNFSDDESRLHESDIIAALQASLNGCAENNFKLFWELTAPWRDSDIMLLHRMMARAMSLAGPEAAQFITSYIIEDERRLHLGEYHEVPHLETKRLIATVGMSENRSEIDRLFDHVMSWTPPQTNWANEKAENLRHWIKKIRCTKLQLLNALPENVLLPKQRRTIAELHRACPDFKPQRDSSGLRMLRAVRSPMSHEQMGMAQDEDILQKLQEFPDNYERPFGGASSRELTNAFGEFAKVHPQRAMDIVNQLPVEQYHNPVECILGPIAGSDTISINDFFAFAREQMERGHNNNDFMEELANAAQSSAKIPDGIPDDFLELFHAALQDIPDEEQEDAANETEKEERDQSILWGMGGLAAVPHGNYTFLSAIWWGYILRKPVQGDAVLDVFLEHLERNDKPGTWQHLALFDLRFLHCCPLDKAAHFINRLFERFPQVLGSSAGVMLIARSCHWAGEADYRVWCDSIRASDWNNGKQAYGELVSLRTLLMPDEQWCQNGINEVLENLDDEYASERLGIAFGAANIWKEGPYRATLTPFLVRLAACNDLAIHNAIIDTFRITSGVPADEQTRQLLAALHEHGVLRQDTGITFVVRALTDLVYLMPDEVHALARDIVDRITNDPGPNSSNRMIDADELNHVAISLTGLGEQYRTLGIELFEDLLRNEVYGVDELLSEIDGIRTQATEHRPRRLRRRRR